MGSLAGRGIGATLAEMRRGILVVLLASGCFAEEPDKVAAPMTTVAAEDEGADEEPELSSSSESTGDASSSEEGSSSEGASEPVCPEWCRNGCDDVLGIYMLCRCASDLDCDDGTTCDQEPGQAGHCV